MRNLVFGPDAKFEKSLGYCVAALEADGHRPREKLVYVAHGTPGPMVARFALRNDRTLFLFVFRHTVTAGPDAGEPCQVKAVPHRAFEGLGWECPHILREMDRAEEISFDPVSQIVMDNWFSGRVALVGDAACAVSFLAAERAGLAMVQAYVLAGELARANGDHREAFRRYQQLLRPLVEAKQRSARTFAWAFAPSTSLGLWTRDQASKLLNIPQLGDWIIRREFRDDIELPDYAT